MTQVATPAAGPASQAVKGKSGEQDEDREEAQQQLRTEAKGGEQVLGEVVNHAESSLSPADADQFAAECDALSKSAALHHQSQGEVFDDFHAERLPPAESVVHLAADHIEGAHANGVPPRPRVRHAPRPYGPDGHHIEKGHHHALTLSLKDQGRHENEMIGPAGLCERQRQAQRILAKKQRLRR